MGVTQKLGTIPLAILTDASNNVGIGAAPSGSYKLEVTGTSNFSGVLRVSAATGFAVGSIAGYRRIEYTGTTFSMLTNADGYANLNAGAATFSSSVQIQSSNGIKLNRSANDYYWQINSDSSNYLNFGAYLANGTPYGTNPKLILLDNGNVGIGTASPNALLSLEKAKAGSGVENLDMISLRLTGTTAIGDGLNIGFFNNNNINVANIRGILGADNVAYGSIGFYTRNFFSDTVLEVMRITNRAEVCIGSTTAVGAGLLNIKGSALQYNLISIQNTYPGGNYIYFMNSSGGQTGGINYLTSSTIQFYTGPSDARLKSNIKDVEESVLPLFNNAKLKTYNHIADEDESVVYKGFLAQDMVDNFPEAYGKDKDGYYMYNPTGYITYLVKAIQELNERLNKAGL
jgi:hypothetical protein